MYVSADITARLDADSELTTPYSIPDTCYLSLYVRASPRRVRDDPGGESSRTARHCTVLLPSVATPYPLAYIIEVYVIYLE